MICRLEDADYEGHSLAMLWRIAAALNQRVEIRLAPIRQTAWRAEPGLIAPVRMDALFDARRWMLYL